MSRTDGESGTGPEVVVFSEERLARALALRLVVPRHTPSGEQAMHVAEGRIEECPGIAPRQRDRRRGLGDLVAIVARAVAGRSEAGLVRGAFEEALTRALPVRGMALRESTSRWAIDKVDPSV